MFIMVFSEEDKNLLLGLGNRFICEQDFGEQKGYVFDKSKINFENNDIQYVEITQLNF